MKKFDITLKDALQGLEKAFCKMFLNLDIISAKPLNTEFKKIEEKQADYIVKIKDKEQKESILHIEFQTSNHNQMHIRMLRYLTELYRVYKLPVIQVVLYLGEEKLNMIDCINFEILKTKIEYRYQIINSKELDCELFLNSQDSDMVVLSILCDLENKDKSKFIRKVLEKLYELNKDDENSFKNFILKLETVSELRKKLKPLIKEQTMVADQISVKNLPTYEIGFEEGIEKGIEKGRQEGQLEEKRAIAFSLIEFHDDETISKITGLPLKEIKKLREKK
jgi:predicted transposase/invertase (TIGR01784 family)